MNMATVSNHSLRARVYCPICTHTVDAEVIAIERDWSRKVKVVEGQKCRRCSTWLDAACVLELPGALNG